MSDNFAANSNEEILMQLRQGNKQALLDLYNQNLSMTKSYILKNNGSNDDAQDILHDALIVLWKNIRKPEFDLTCKPSTYLNAVVRNLWLKKLQKIKNQSTSDITTLEVSDEPLTVHQMDVKKAMLAMDEIGDTCKKILEMFYFDGFDMAHIATSMNYNNADTAKAKKHQCFKRLSEIIKQRYTIQDIFG